MYLEVKRHLHVQLRMRTCFMGYEPSTDSGSAEVAAAASSGAKVDGENDHGGSAVCHHSCGYGYF